MTNLVCLQHDKGEARFLNLDNVVNAIFYVEELLVQGEILEWQIAGCEPDGLGEINPKLDYYIADHRLVADITINAVETLITEFGMRHDELMHQEFRGKAAEELLSALRSGKYSFIGGKIMVSQ